MSGEHVNPYVSTESPKFDFELALSDLLSDPTPDQEIGKLSGVHELNYRTGDGLNVSHLWDADTKLHFMSVEDKRTGESFIVDVPEGKDPNFYFHHPLAQPKRRGTVAVNGFKQESDSEAA
jgi:hypothetical protein